MEVAPQYLGAQPCVVTVRYLYLSIMRVVHALAAIP